jgi:chromosome segregation ATPase
MITALDHVMTTTPDSSARQDALADLGAAFDGATAALATGSASLAASIPVVVGIDQALARADEFMTALQPWLDAARPGETMRKDLAERQSRLASGGAEMKELRSLLDQLTRSDQELRAQAEERGRLQDEVSELQRIESAAIGLDQLRALRDQLVRRTAQLSRPVNEAEGALARAAEDVVIVAANQLEHVRARTRELLSEAAAADAGLSAELRLRQAEYDRLVGERNRVEADLADITTRLESESSGFEQVSQELSERIRQLQEWADANSAVRDDVPDADAAIGDRLDRVERELDEANRALRQALLMAETAWREDRKVRRVNVGALPVSMGEGEG